MEIYSLDVSVSAWFKTNTTSNSRICSKGSSSCLTGYMIRTNYVNGNQHVLWEMSSNNYCILQLTGTTMINDNKWNQPTNPTNEWYFFTPPTQPTSFDQTKFSGSQTSSTTDDDNSGEMMNILYIYFIVH